MRFFRKPILPCAASLACFVAVVVFSPTPRIPSAYAISVVRDKKLPATIHPFQKKQQHRPKQPILFVASTSSDETNEQENTNYNPAPSLGTTTVPQEIFNLIKSIIGAGVLSLPAGIALMATSSAGTSSRTMVVLTACGLIAIMGIISGYTFSLIARCCKMTNTETYADCWRATRGPSFAWMVALSSTLDCFAGNLTFSMVLADTFHQLLSFLFEIGGKTHPRLFATLESYNSRSRVLLFFTVTCLMPLCCIKNLSSLAPFSLVGILGILYTALVIGLRFFDGSYQLPNGRFLADLELGPFFVESSKGASLLQNLQNPKTLILVSMLSTAYIAHFNAPKFYRELKDVETHPRRFHLGVVAFSFGACIVFYALVSSLGYLTFGSATKAMILGNYSTNDVLISLSRFAMGVSLITSYPLLFVGLRTGIIDLIHQLSPLLHCSKTKGTIQQPTEQQQQPRQFKLTNRQSDVFTVVLVSLITMLALKITDITFVASMSGALLGTSLIFIFPPLMFRSALAMETRRTNTPFTKLQRLEQQLCLVIIALGVFIAAVGATIAWNR